MRNTKPPQVDLNSPEVARKAIALSGRADVRTFVDQMNVAYHSWSDVRYRPRPEGLNVEDAWLVVKWSRRSFSDLPIQDVKGRPFRFWLPPSAQRALHMLDRQAGDLLSFEGVEKRGLELTKTRVLIDSHMEEAIATSQIEGAVTTRREAKNMLRAGRTPRDRSEQMIVNGYRTIQLLSEHAKKPMSVELLHQIQASMTEGTLDNADHSGRFRRPSDPQVDVVDTRDNEVVFTPPPPELIDARMQRLIDFANEPPDVEPFIHPLVRASVLHFWLAYEHPYNDGNGRTARSLFYWYMLKSGYWLFEFLTISRVIHAGKMKYYRAFVFAETDDYDLTYFILYKLRATGKAIEQLREQIRNIAIQEQRVRSVLGDGGFNARQRALIDHAIRHPTQVYTFESHRNSNGITLLTARQDLIELVEKKLLHEVGKKRPREFSAAPTLLRRAKRASAD